MAERVISACGPIRSACDVHVAAQANDVEAIRRVDAPRSERFAAGLPTAGVGCDGCMSICDMLEAVQGSAGGVGCAGGARVSADTAAVR